jgi:thioredoxin-related protein
MKKIGVFILLWLSFSVSLAQEWQNDISVARAIASEKDLPIILVFQGSDWCAPCIRLEREIWSSKVFKDYAREHFVMLKADFPKKKANALPEEQTAKNKALADKYNKKGYFPFVVVMDKEGTVLGTTGYKKINPEQYIAHLESLKS